ncbi:hypothetical protein [Novipirellula sp.]|uniref:hypothetical protein n=1 Tax=Novipirellula sp. TaxID=2795430 RepID=UPI0035668459
MRELQAIALKEAKKTKPEPIVTQVSRGDRTPLELFRSGVVDLQTSQPDISGRVVAVLA